MDSQQATRLDTPPFSVARFICEGYEQDPFKQMVVGMNEGITYAEAYRRMVALAGFLRREQGVGEGDTVMIAAPNIIAYFVLIGAIQLAGATVALMSPTVERTEFAGIYDRVHPAVAIVSTEAHCRLAAECSPATKVMTATCPVDGVLSVEQAWRGSAAWDGPSFDEDPKFVLFTSGSTGTPKAVQLRGSSFCRHAGELTRALRVKPGEVFFIPVPFAHVYGVVALHTALSHHATVATLVKYRPEQAMSLVASVQANVYLGVSTMYLRELRENQDGEWDLSCLRAGLVAGATSPLAVFEEYEKRYGAILVNSYGMTETAATLTVASWTIRCASARRRWATPSRGPRCAPRRSMRTATGSPARIPPSQRGAGGAASSSARRPRSPTASSGPTASSSKGSTPRGGSTPATSAGSMRTTTCGWTAASKT